MGLPGLLIKSFSAPKALSCFERWTSNIEHRTSNVEHLAAISGFPKFLYEIRRLCIKSFFPIQNSMLDFRCSMFISPSGAKTTQRLCLLATYLGLLNISHFLCQIPLRPIPTSSRTALKFQNMSSCPSFDSDVFAWSICPGLLKGPWL